MDCPLRASTGRFSLCSNMNGVYKEDWKKSFLLWIPQQSIPRSFFHAEWKWTTGNNQLGHFTVAERAGGFYLRVSAKHISRVSTCEAGSPLGLLIWIFLDRNHGCYMSYSPTLPANLSQCKTPTIGQKKLNMDNVLASNVYFSNSFGFNLCSVVQYLFNVFLGLINQQSLSNDIK